MRIINRGVRHRTRRALAFALVGGVISVSLTGSLSSVVGEPSTSAFVDDPAELLGRLQSARIQQQQIPAARFFDVFTELAPQANIGRQCDLLLRETRLKGFRRDGRALPSTCLGFRNSSFARDAFFDISLGDGQNTVHLIGASIETDTHVAHGSRAFFDIWIDRQNPQASIVQLTLTNNWADQPEIVKSATGRLQVNGENRFFVDVARVLQVNVVGANPTLRLFWYRYWWHDSHNHAWWWYGGYNWWYWQYAWWGGSWYWWWGMWWPWWHGYHWWYWSNWWGDLNRVRQP